MWKFIIFLLLCYLQINIATKNISLIITPELNCINDTLPIKNLYSREQLEWSIKLPAGYKISKIILDCNHIETTEILSCSLSYQYEEEICLSEQKNLFINLYYAFNNLYLAFTKLSFMGKVFIFVYLSTCFSVVYVCRFSKCENKPCSIMDFLYNRSHNN